MPYLNCLHCGNKFYTRPSAIKQGYGKYCSKTCSNLHNNPNLSNRVPADIEDAIISAYQSGKSKKQAGEMYGYGRGATDKILKRRNVTPRTVSQSLRGRVFTQEWKDKIAKNHTNVSGSNNPMYATAPGHGKWTYVDHLGKRVRSTWEAVIATILRELEIPHEYEVHRIYLSNMTYLPDFYLPTYNKFIEVKGWENARFKRILDALSVEKPQIYNRLLIINADIYKRVSVEPRELLALLD